MRQLRLLASNSLIASISINFRSDEAVSVTTDRSGPTGNVPLHENRLAGREFVGCVRSPKMHRNPAFEPAKEMKPRFRVVVP